ncbi:MAG: hypothetical protein IGS38_04425 [Synechococcales cyanobacterium M58_A2018_015]|nr:hypothetical protein [Synechococcales cyanobacterium M58_A2018_015]
MRLRAVLSPHDFVTGASGNTGMAVVDQFRRRQIPIRIGARSAGSDLARWQQIACVSSH